MLYFGSMIDSKDILYIILSFCVLWFTFFLCWFLYQLAKVFHNVNEVIREVKVQVEKVELALHGIKSKFDLGAAQIAFLTEAVKKASDMWKTARREFKPDHSADQDE